LLTRFPDDMDRVMRPGGENYSATFGEKYPAVDKTSEEELVAAIRLLEDHGMVPTYETLRCIIMHQAVQLPETSFPPDRISMEEPNFSHYDSYLRGVL